VTLLCPTEKKKVVDKINLNEAFVKPPQVSTGEVSIFVSAFCLNHLWKENSLIGKNISSICMYVYARLLRKSN